MSIQVRLFAAAQDLVGQPSIDVPIHLPATIRQIREMVARSHPCLEGVLRRSRFAVDLEYRQDHDMIHSAKEIALIPPVSGG